MSRTFRENTTICGVQPCAVVAGRPKTRSSWRLQQIAWLEFLTIALRGQGNRPTKGAQQQSKARLELFLYASVTTVQTSNITGAYAERFWGGSPNPAGGLGGAVSPPAGSGAEPRKILKLTLFRGKEHLFPWVSYPSVVMQKSMLFSSYIVIRTTSRWQLNEPRSCPITRFDTKKANGKELPSFESCSSPAPWGLLVFWILETAPHCDPGPKDAVHSHIHMHSLSVQR